MNREELERIKEQVLENNGKVSQPVQAEDSSKEPDLNEQPKVLVKAFDPGLRMDRVKNILGAKRNGYVDAIILSFITSIGGGIILYLIMSAI